MKLAELLQTYAEKSPRSDKLELTVLRPETDLPSDLSDWPEEWHESYEERAAIMEYDGELDRLEAEERAEEIVREAYRRQQIVGR